MAFLGMGIKTEVFHRFHPVLSPALEQCFTCSKPKVSLDTASVVLEFQGLANGPDERSTILQVICQLLRVQWPRMRVLVTRGGELPFCASCLKKTTEIIKLRENLFRMESEIRQKLAEIEVSVTENLEGCFGKPDLEEIAELEYADLRNIFQDEVMEEYKNKQLLKMKVLEMNRFPTTCSPSLVQLHLAKNVFEIIEREQVFEEIEEKKTGLLLDASTDTKDLPVVQCSSSRPIEINDLEMPELEAEGRFPSANDCEVEDFTLIPVCQISEASDDSDYGSPSKMSKPAIDDVPLAKSQPIVKAKPKPKAKPRPRRQIIRKKATKPKKLFQEESSLPQEKESQIQCSAVGFFEDESVSLEDKFESEDDNADNDDNGNASSCEDSVHGSDSSDTGSEDVDEEKDAILEKEEKDESLEKDSLEVRNMNDFCRKQTFTPKYSRDPNMKHITHAHVKLEQPEATFTAKDKTIWTTKEPNQKRQTRRYEILREDGGLTGPAKDPTLTPPQLFKLMFPPSIVEIIARHTNEYAKQSYSPAEKSNWCPVTVDEIYAYIGILLFFGLEKKRNVSYHEAWTMDEKYSIPSIVATMSRNRFGQIQSCIRFDDKTKRVSDAAVDDAKFGYISEVLEPFVQVMQSHLRPYENLVVDEMLVKFRGSVKFRVYMKSKPGKYGIKFGAVCDVETGYVLNISLYQGKLSTGVERELGKKVVLKLVEKYFNSGRAVTMDNFFTSKSLGQELIKQNMSMLGTLNKSRMDVIPKFVDVKGREVQSSVFAFQGDFTMVSYVQRSNRPVILMSTQHHSAEVVPEVRNKPQMILDYNATKGGVDTADNMIAKYSCQRASCRWPVKIFQALCDIAALNAYVVHRIHHPETSKSSGRKDFLRNVCEGLMEPVRMARAQSVRSGSCKTVQAAFARMGCARLPTGRSSGMRKVVLHLSPDLFTTERSGALTWQRPKTGTDDAGNLIGIGSGQVSAECSTFQRMIITSRKCVDCSTEGRQRTTNTACSQCYNGICKSHQNMLILCNKCLYTESGESRAKESFLM